MGLLTMVLARRRGARRLILPDVLEERRRIAKRLGARTVVGPAREDLRARVMALTRGRGADVICEAVGKPELVAEAVRLTRFRGVVNLVGVSPQGRELPLDLFDAQYREIRIGGIFGRGAAFGRALALLPGLGVARLSPRVSRSTRSARPSPTPRPAKASRRCSRPPPPRPARAPERAAVRRGAPQ